jgi:hypothetical protein
MSLFSSLTRRGSNLSAVVETLHQVSLTTTRFLQNEIIKESSLVHSLLQLSWVNFIFRLTHKATILR